MDKLDVRNFNFVVAIHELPLKNPSMHKVSGTRLKGLWGRVRKRYYQAYSLLNSAIKEQKWAFDWSDTRSLG